jgi:rubrerythrin
VVTRAGGLSRRRLIAGAGTGAAGTLAVLLSGCGGNSAGKEKADLYGQASEERTADAAMLDAALEIELSIAALYAAIEQRVGGAPRALALVRRIAAQEDAHAQSLRKAIQGLGSVPTVLPAKPVSAPRNVGDALGLAVREENRAIAFYVDALPKLSADNKLRAPLASIMTNEAEHVTLLAQALGLPPAQALVRGQP